MATRTPVTAVTGRQPVDEARRLAALNSDKLGPGKELAITTNRPRLHRALNHPDIRPFVIKLAKLVVDQVAAYSKAKEAGRTAGATATEEPSPIINVTELAGTLSEGTGAMLTPDKVAEVLSAFEDPHVTQVIGGGGSGLATAQFVINLRDDAPKKHTDTSKAVFDVVSNLQSSRAPRTQIAVTVAPSYEDSAAFTSTVTGDKGTGRGLLGKAAGGFRGGMGGGSAASTSYGEAFVAAVAQHGGKETTVMVAEFAKDLESKDIDAETVGEMVEALNSALSYDPPTFKAFVEAAREQSTGLPTPPPAKLTREEAEMEAKLQAATKLEADGLFVEDLETPASSLDVTGTLAHVDATLQTLSDYTGITEVARTPAEALAKVSELAGVTGAPDADTGLKLEIATAQLENVANLKAIATQLKRLDTAQARFEKAFVEAKPILEDAKAKKTEVSLAIKATVATKTDTSAALTTQLKADQQAKTELGDVTDSNRAQHEALDIKIAEATEQVSLLSAEVERLTSEVAVIDEFLALPDLEAITVLHDELTAAATAGATTSGTQLAAVLEAQGAVESILAQISAPNEEGVVRLQSAEDAAPVTKLLNERVLEAAQALTETIGVHATGVAAGVQALS